MSVKNTYPLNHQFSSIIFMLITQKVEMDHDPFNLAVKSLAHGSKCP